MIHVGLIGCGEHSEIGHAIPLARYRDEHSDDIELTAVCDPRNDRAERFRQKYGFLNVHSSLEAMLDDHQLDLCIAVVPVDKIPAIGVHLLQSGIPCVVEKPLGASLPDINALRDAARSLGTPNMVSVNRRFMPFLTRAIEWTRGRGDLRYVRAIMTRHARTEPEFLWGTAVHSLDALRHIAGNINRAVVQKIAQRGSADWYTIDLEFKSGASGRVDVLPTAGFLEETYELSGDGFRVVVTAPFGPDRGLRCYQENHLVLHETDKDVPEDVVFGFYDETASAIRSLLAGETLMPTIEDVYPSVELCFNLAARAEGTLPST